MKCITTIIIIVLCNFCFSQTVVPIEQRKNTDEYSESYYFKDMNVVFDKFLGSWRYQDQAVNPNEIVEITFYKRERVKTGFNGFKDELFARIKYIENGAIIYNTYPIIQPTLNKRDHNIVGGFFPDPNNTSLLSLGYYSEPGLGGETGTLKLEHYLVNGVEYLKWDVSSFRVENGGTPFRMPLFMDLERI